MKHERLLKYVLAPALLLVAASAQAQTTTPVTVQPFLCINQTSFYCYSAPVTAAINGQTVSGTMTLDIFRMSYGYVSFNISGVYVYGDITTVQVVSMNNLGQVTEMKVAFASQSDPDNNGDTDTVTGLLDLSVTWTAYSSGGGRGTHNVIWRPTISGPGSYSND
jgi:hypothetical protein